MAKQEGFISLRITPQPYRTVVPTGIRGVAFYVTFTSTTLRVEIFFQLQSDKVNKARFDAIAFKQDEIDKALDRKLSWERRAGQIGSCIELLLPLNYQR